MQLSGKYRRVRIISELIFSSSVLTHVIMVPCHVNESNSRPCTDRLLPTKHSRFHLRHNNFLISDPG